MIVDCPSIRGLMRNNQMLTDKIQQASHHMPMPCMRWFALIPGANPIGLLGILGISKRKPGSFICPLAQGPGSLTTTQAPHQEQEYGTGLAEWPGRIRLAAHGAPLCARLPIASSPSALLIHGAHCAPAFLPVLGHDAHTEKINILKSHESSEAFTYFAS